EFLQLLRQQSVIPGGDLSEPVVGDHKRASLCGAQMIQAEGRHLGHAERAGGQDPAVTGNYPSAAIYQDRDNETESLDALRELPDLLLAMPARVRRIERELVDRPLDDRTLRHKSGRSVRCNT